jgi:hypothetical protein
MAEKTARKQPTGGPGRPFKPGQSGNPSGRPLGARNRTTLAVEELLAGEAEEITRAVIEKAKAGETAAIRLCMDRIAPVRRGRPIQLRLLNVNSIDDVAAALATVVKSMAEGELTPDEAASVASVLEGHRRAIETVEIEKRVTALEQKADFGG